MKVSKDATIQRVNRGRLYDTYECSFCGAWNIVPVYTKPEYCCNCGAKVVKNNEQIGEDASKDGTSVKEIIAEWLRINDYDGLCNPYSNSGCGLDDLMPCRCPNERGCVCAYKILDTDEPEYPIYVVSDGVSTYEYCDHAERR